MFGFQLMFVFLADCGCLDPMEFLGDACFLANVGFF